MLCFCISAVCHTQKHNGMYQNKERTLIIRYQQLYIRQHLIQYRYETERSSTTTFYSQSNVQIKTSHKFKRISIIELPAVGTCAFSPKDIMSN